MKIPQMFLVPNALAKTKIFRVEYHLYTEDFIFISNTPIPHHAEEEQKQMVFHLRLRLARC